MPRSTADVSPEGGRLPLLLLGLTAAGILVAGYLTLIHYRGDLLVCSIGSCETVQSSEYAELFGLPVALLGLLMFIAVLGLLIVMHFKPAWRQTVTLALFVLTLAGTIFSAYLTYLEFFVIDAICQWCVLTALLTLSLCLLSGYRALHLLETEVILDGDRQTVERYDG